MSDGINTEQTTNVPVATPQTGAAPATQTPATESAPQTESQTQATPPAQEAPKQKGQEPNSDTKVSLLDEGDKEPKEGEPKEGEEPSVLGAPEEGYQFEGYDPANAGIQAFSKVAQELNLSQESANKIMSQSLAGLKESQEKDRADCVRRSLEDKELGLSDPANVQQVRATFAKYFGDKPQLRAKLRAINLDVDPDFIGVFKRIGSELSEGTFVEGQRQATADQNDYRALYPNTKMNR